MVVFMVSYLKSSRSFQSEDGNGRQGQWVLPLVLISLLNFKLQQEILSNGA